VTVPARTISGLMAALVAELVEAEGGAGFDPLDERLTLSAVWSDLCRLADESSPVCVWLALDGTSPSTTSAPTTGGIVTGLCERLMTDLTMGGVPQALSQRFTLALLWLDLARLAGETAPAEVQARLDCPIMPRPLSPLLAAR